MFTATKKTLILILCFCLIASMVGCGRKQSEAPETGFVQMGNPLVTVDSLQEMESKLGYAVPVLDKEVASYIVLVINGTAESGRIRYADGSDFNIKKGTGDISGIYGGVLDREEALGGVSVSFMVMEDTHYAIWEKDGFTYSLTGDAVLADAVTTLIGK